MVQEHDAVRNQTTQLYELDSMDRFGNHIQDITSEDQQRLMNKTGEISVPVTKR